MSIVTNIILTTGLEANRTIESINRSYASIVGYPVRVFSLSCMTHVGGNKNLACCVHVSAMNNLHEEQLIGLIETTCWECPEEVQLFLKRQDDEVFTQVKLNLLREDEI